MITGNLQIKNDKYYAVLNLKVNGKRKPKWIALGMPVRGNKRNAEAELMRLLNDYELEAVAAANWTQADVLLADYLQSWLKMVKPTIATSTHQSYKNMIDGRMDRHFRALGVSLGDLTPTQIQDFYQIILDEGYTPNTVIHYHAVLRRALQNAVKKDIIARNPADRIDKPKKNQYRANHYSEEEMLELFDVIIGDPLELAVKIGAYYGLRRSEVLGLKWDAIDFEANTLEVKHIVTQASIDGKKVLVQADRAKTKSSLRTLPLVPPIRDRLLMLKGQQETYRRLCGKSYNRDYLGYLCVDEIGNIIRPNYVSEQFPKLLEKNGLRPIRFHDLRHSCASLLLANGVPMKQIQEWLGHSDFSTTANIYAHLDYASKLSSAQAMLEGLGYGNASA